MLSFNTDIDRLEFDRQRVTVECPHCQYVSQTFLSPVVQHLERVRTPGGEAIEDFETSEEYRAGQQMVLDFYRDHLLKFDGDDASDNPLARHVDQLRREYKRGVECSLALSDHNWARPGNVYDGAGYLIAYVGPAEPGISVNS